MDISAVFRIFCFAFLGLSAVTAVVNIFAVFSDKRDAAQMRSLFHDCVFIAVLFGILSWLLS